MEGLAGDAEGIETLRRGDGDDDIGVGQEIAASIIDGDDAFADIAGAVGDDGGGGDADVAVPGLVRLCVPGDLDCLADGEFADLRLVEVGVDLDFVEVGDVDQVLAGGHKIVGGDGNGVDGAGLLASGY